MFFSPSSPCPYLFAFVSSSYFTYLTTWYLSTVVGYCTIVTEHQQTTFTPADDTLAPTLDNTTFTGAKKMATSKRPANPVGIEARKRQRTIPKKASLQKSKVSAQPEPQCSVSSSRQPSPASSGASRPVETDLVVRPIKDHYNGGTSAQKIKEQSPQAGPKVQNNDSPVSTSKFAHTSAILDEVPVSEISHYQNLYRKLQKDYEALNGEIILLRSKEMDKNERLKAENQMLRQQLVKAREGAFTPEPSAEKQQKNQEHKMQPPFLERSTEKMGAENSLPHQESERPKTEIDLLGRSGLQVEDKRFIEVDEKYCSECEKWKSEKSDLEGKIKCLEKNREVDKTEMDCLRTKQPDMNEMQKKIRSERDQWKREKATLEKSYETKCAQHEEEIRTLKKSKEEEALRVDNLTAKLHQSKDRKTKTLARLDQLAQKLEKERKVTIDLQRQQDKAKEGYKNALREAKSKLESVERQLEAEQKSNQQKRKALEKKEDSNRQQIQRESRNELEEAKELSQTYYDEIQDMRKALKDLRHDHLQEIGNISKTLSKKDEEIQNLKDLWSSSVANAEQQASKSVDLAAKLQKYGETESDLKDEVEYYKKELDKSELRSRKQGIENTRILAYWDYQEVSVLQRGAGTDWSGKQWDRWQRVYVGGGRATVLEAITLGKSMEEALQAVETKMGGQAGIDCEPVAVEETHTV